MKIKEVVEITGVSSHTIRFYEKSGLLPEIQRSDTGVRQFTESDVNIIQFVSSLRRTGLAIKDIVEFTKDSVNLEQLIGQNYSLESIQRRLSILVGHREKLVEQQHELDMLHEAVNHLISMHEAIRRRLSER